MFQVSKFRSKYNNVTTVYGGHYFDSKLEASYASFLDMLKKAGKVKDWRPQVFFPLEVNGKKVCGYRLDFVVDYTDGRTEYVEVKGFWTPEARIKVKLFEAIQGQSVKIILKVPFHELTPEIMARQ